MRENPDIVKQLRQAMLDLDELKTAQQVGTSQIIAKPYNSGAAYDKQFTCSATFQYPEAGFKIMRITLLPENLLPNNIPVAHVIPDLRYLNGNRVSRWDFTTNERDYTTFYFLTPIDQTNTQQPRYLLGVVAPKNTVMRLKLWITANCDLTFNIEELN